MTDLDHVAALLGSGYLLPEHAISIGESLLAGGDDHESVVALAMLSRNDRDDLDAAADRLADVLGHLGVPVPEPEEAAFRLGLDEVRVIAEGTRDPLEGARWIWTTIWAKYRFEEFSPFVALIDDLAEAVTSKDRSALAAQIVAHAREMTGTSKGLGDDAQAPAGHD